ncbi:hypothetical protein OIU79_015779 [Salix purpurea]|uniref:Uncharacterized protein n=1 Tax=Salix purpurea TaxID=77065 RepID=A0A9Q0SQC5_SALPP|nr:hypothetical protein OIU79_015779 [Salix purpurea]
MHFPTGSGAEHLVQQGAMPKDCEFWYVICNILKPYFMVVRQHNKANDLEFLWRQLRKFSFNAELHGESSTSILLGVFGLRSYFPSEQLSTEFAGSN